MSRCFAFPPPGYEKKHRPEEDLLKEEKHSGKKHKKEKKDKEKREGKDKKERDKSDGKQKEKKDKKEKHRDKKEKHRDQKKDKDKDRSKDKEKSSISEDASIAGQPETSSVEKVDTREECLRDKSHSSDKKQFTLHPEGQNGQNRTDKRLFVQENEESKFVQELGRRIRDEGKATGSRSVERFSGSDSKVHQETVPVRDPQNLVEDKGRNRASGVDKKGVDRQEITVGARFSGNTMVQNLAAVSVHKAEGITLPAPKNTERIVEWKPRFKDRGDDKQGEKRKDKDKDKKSHGKDKGREKEKKKEEKMEERTENKKNDQGKSKELYGNKVSGFNNYSSHLLTDGNKNVTAVDILKKRKDVETNGFLHENEVRANKLPRPTSLQLTENGRIPEAFQIPSLLASNKQGVASNSRVGKEHRVNGTIEAPPFIVSNQKPPPAATGSDQLVGELPKPPQPSLTGPVEVSRRLPLTDQVAEGSKKHCQASQTAEPSGKPPHPDLKYLSQVLSVPKMEWSEVDGQEWLFKSKDPPLKKPEVGSSADNKKPVVWSEALHIESADIYALPYVTPY